MNLLTKASLTGLVYGDIVREFLAINIRERTENLSDFCSHAPNKHASSSTLQTHSLWMLPDGRLFIEFPTTFIAVSEEYTLDVYCHFLNAYRLTILLHGAVLQQRFA
jgi:hypothetical protein